MLALNELKRNTKGEAKVMGRLSSGQKINGAGDDAAKYSISEKMRVQLRGLKQADMNTKNMQDLVDLASAAVDQQVDIMRKVYTIALKASDDTYTDIDRQNLQKEVSQLLDQSDDIAQYTSYNGIPLLNQRTIAGEKTYFDADAPYRQNEDPLKVIDQFATDNDISTPMGSYNEILLSPANTYDPTGGYKAGNAYDPVPSAGTWVWNNDAGALDQIDVDANGDKIFASTGLPADTTNTYSVKYATANTSMPAVGSKVAVSEDVSFSTAGTPMTRLYDVATEPGTDETTYFNPDVNTYVQEISFSSLFSAGMNIPSDLNNVGLSIACGGCDQFVSIIFNANSATSEKYIGESEDKDPLPIAYVIGVSGVTDETSLIEAIYNGIANSDKKAIATPDLLPSTTNISTQIAEQHNIELNYHASTGKITITKEQGPAMLLHNGTMGELATDYVYDPSQPLIMQSSTVGSQHTVIKVPNTTTEMLFPHNTSHWDIIPTEEDFPHAYSSDYSGCANETERRDKWLDESWPYPRLTTVDLDNCVATRAKASEFLGAAQQAIKYLTQANTTLGAQSNRTEKTSDNLVTETENLTASESVLRDADMSNEMVNFTKMNVLAQASQAMLAQANQNASKVLSLLQ